MKIWIMVFKNIGTPVLAQVDFIKDLLQVALLTVAVGGPTFVLLHISSFSSVVCKKNIFNLCTSKHLHPLSSCDTIYF